MEGVNGTRGDLSQLWVVVIFQILQLSTGLAPRMYVQLHSPGQQDCKVRFNSAVGSLQVLRHVMSSPCTTHFPLKRNAQHKLFAGGACGQRS